MEWYIFLYWLKLILNFPWVMVLKIIKWFKSLNNRLFDFEYCRLNGKYFDSQKRNDNLIIENDRLKKELEKFTDNLLESHEIKVSDTHLYFEFVFSKNKINSVLYGNYGRHVTPKCAIHKSNIKPLSNSWNEDDYDIFYCSLCRDISNGEVYYNLEVMPEKFGFLRRKIEALEEEAFIKLKEKLKYDTQS